MSQLWTITDTASGEVLYAAFHTPSVGSHPKDNGWDWNPATMKATRIDAAPNQVSQRWTGAAWVDDLVKIKAIAVDRIKTEAERRKMLFLTAGGAKKSEYAEKRAEVAFWDSLGGTVTVALAALRALPTPAQQAKFAYALADAAAFGDTVADAIGRFRIGITQAANVPGIAAAEAKTCAAIAAATTTAAVNSAAAGIKWPA